MKEHGDKNKTMVKLTGALIQEGLAAFFVEPLIEQKGQFS